MIVMSALHYYSGSVIIIRIIIISAGKVVIDRLSANLPGTFPESSLLI